MNFETGMLTHKLKVAHRQLENVKTISYLADGHARADQVVRVGFGIWGAAIRGAGRHVVQNTAYIYSEYADVAKAVVYNVRCGASVLKTLQCAAASHCHAQQQALKKWFSRSLATHMITSTTCDDTNVIVANNGSKRRFVPLLGINESVYVRRAGDASLPLEAVDLVTPGLVLPRANWATLANRLNRWRVLTPSGCGICLGGDSATAVVAHCPVKISLLCTDALVTNHALIAREQTEWAKARALNPSLAVAFLAGDCQHHQAALGKKPMILAVPGLCAGLVRLTHLFESSVFVDKMEAALLNIVKQLEWNRCMELPDACKTWRSRNLALLLRAHCDLLDSMDIYAEYLQFFNGNWLLTLRLVHWCLPGCCASREEAINKAMKLLRATLLRFPSVPLLYRWKHFDPALAWLARNKGLHGLLLAVMRTSLSKMPVINTGDHGSDDENMPFALKHATRGERSVRLLMRSSIMSDTAMCTLLCGPLSRFAEDVSRADSATMKYLASLTHKISETRATAAVAACLNVAILTGDRGQQVVADYSSYLLAPLGSESFRDITGINATESEYWCSIVIGICESWRRLVHSKSGFPWQLFRLVGLTIGNAQLFINDLERLQCRCSLCVDDSFTGALLALLRSGASLEHLQQIITDVATVFKVSSVSVEKQHTKYQTPSGRGVVNSSARVQIETYLTGARTAHQATRTAVERHVCGASKRGIARMLFTRRVNSSAPCNLSKTQPRPRKTMEKASFRINSTWHIFLSEQKRPCKTTSPEFKPWLKSMSELFAGRSKDLSHLCLWFQSFLSILYCHCFVSLRSGLIVGFCVVTLSLGFCCFVVLFNCLLVCC